MILTLTVIVTIGIAVTIGTYLFSRHHLTVLSDRVEEAVRLEVERISQKAQKSKDRLIQAFVNWADEDEALQCYQRQQAALLTAYTIDQPWAWGEPRSRRLADQTRRERCAAGQRSALITASLCILGLWCMIVVVAVLSIPGSGTTTVMPTPGSLDADRPWTRSAVVRSHSFLGLKTGECET